MKPEFDSEKFRELVLYIAGRSIEDPKFSVTKLAKILCWSDFLMYGHYGSPITGATYLKYPHGPYPQELDAIQRSLRELGAADIYEAPYHTYIQKRLLPRRPPDLARFSATEIAIVDQVIDDLRDFNAKEVSDQSHDLLVGWKLAAPFEEIPYTTIFLSPEPPSLDDIEWAKDIAREQGLLSPA